ncbi:hypothetical protein ONZ45_g4084 [Pleurotus djamor]|nr:hypothetical protein ONZ45_g4084 [Pleurotus djamor]
MVVVNGLNLNLFVKRIGPLFIGIILNWSLLGILAVQFCTYVQIGTRDLLAIKVFVVFVMILDIMQTVFTTHLSWNFLVENWGDIHAILSPPWTTTTISIMGGLISAAVQFFYAWRITRLKNNRLTQIIVVFIILIAITQVISALVGSLKLTLSGDLASPSDLSAYFTVWLVGSFIDDFIIAVTMYTILSAAARRTLSKDMGSQLERIMQLSIQTGAITAIVALVQLILFLYFKDNNLHSTPALILGKLYSNAMLASLNSRGSSAASRSHIPEINTNFSFSSNLHGLPTNDTELTQLGGRSRMDTSGMLTTREDIPVRSPGIDADLKYRRDLIVKDDDGNISFPRPLGALVD